MEEDLASKTSKAIERILKEGIATTNIDNLYKLVDIYKDAKEVESMNYGNYNGYGNYGNYGRPGYDSYGRDSYGEYGRRGYDMEYRGYENLDRMAGEYGRYMDSRERYGANEETNKAFEYMAHSAGDFIKYLFEIADTPQQKNMLKESLQKSMM